MRKLDRLVDPSRRTMKRIQMEQSCSSIFSASLLLLLLMLSSSVRPPVRYWFLLLLQRRVKTFLSLLKTW